MGDFYQNGIIATLHNLSSRSLEDLESELMSFRDQRPMALILPSLYSELSGPALDNIIEEIKHAHYLNEIVIGLDRANVDEYKHALQFFERLPQHHRVLWNDGPRLTELDARLRSLNLAPKEYGKGRNVWYCMGYILATQRSEAVALHDCDIVTYDRSLLARLIYPVSNPQFNYEFCKGYYSRVGNNTVNGRVCRLLVTPLIHALTKMFGITDYLRFMDSFRYALAGEFSFRRDVLNDLRIPDDWGLEIGVLSEMQRNFSPNRICQADIADRYDHKHQNLSLDNQSDGLSKMSIDITKAFFRKLATQGVTFNTETFRSLKATYYRIALDFIESYHSDAIMNGLKLDIHQEEKAVEMFAKNIMRAGELFIDRPMEAPFIPSWNRTISAVPDILEQLRTAVEEDHNEFCQR